jgi:hypothetical protein
MCLLKRGIENQSGLDGEFYRVSRVEVDLKQTTFITIKYLTGKASRVSVKGEMLQLVLALLLVI